MARRFQPRRTAGQNLRSLVHAIPWRLLLLVPVLVILAIPAFYFGAHAGRGIFPSISGYIYQLSGTPPPLTPTPEPAFVSVLPQPGSLLYTAQEGDNCDEILSVQMHMADAGMVFSEARPNTIRALSATLGQNCSDLQPGRVLRLSPQYPLLALGGRVLSATVLTAQQVLPTPVINVVRTPQLGVDCAGGCKLSVRVAANSVVRLFVVTTLPVQIGSWVWAQVAYGRQQVKGFGNYPYVDPRASLNGMELHACDLQVDNTHDVNSLPCDQLAPNTIDDDGGAWLFGVSGSNSLGHWGYPPHVQAGVRVMLWLTLGSNGGLLFHTGNPVYRFDDGTHLYVKV
jgi:hypothetical protein